MIIWAVSDGRAGIENQVLGLADAIAHHVPALVVPKRVAWKRAVRWLPPQLNPATNAWLEDPAVIRPPWPDLWIGAGRASLPLALRIKRRSGGVTFVVQLQDPRVSPSRFDLVIPPEHDRLSGPQVFPIVGAPNRLTPERLHGECARWGEALAALPRPRVAVLVGGKSKAFDLPPERARAMAEEVATAVRAAGGSVLFTASRRTPEVSRRILAEALSSLPGIVWDGTGPNPYFAFLGAADHVLVTEDSTNLATDAAVTGKPVHVLKMAGASAKLARFHASLEGHGIARPFRGVLDAWRYEPLAETERAAQEVLKRMGAA
ncbi:MAG TPA: mitochondrial fission ELM1 family protein [Caulobacteraceae bacterium]|nr:mitochondrial fission ELM1 family protein [Caulobacteraceae bacterium]